MHPACCQVCETLDRRQGIEASEMWPVPPAVPDAGAPAGSDPDTADAQQDGNAQQSADTWEDQPVHAKLAAVLDHLRQTYHYCLYCGCQVSRVGIIASYVLTDNKHTPCSCMTMFTKYKCQQI